MSNRRSFLKSLGLGAAGAATMSVAGGAIARTERSIKRDRKHLPILEFVNLPNNMRIEVINANTHEGVPFYAEELSKGRFEMHLRDLPDQVQVTVSEQRELFRSGEASMTFVPRRGQRYIFDYKREKDNGSWRNK